ncbi:MAG: sigma-70 family RNA polymerase sigma factor [Clostridia bacterium]|nr:sigma-70 family RNA polymerase sigma factor [Clostridia bacterium]
MDTLPQKNSELAVLIDEYIHSERDRRIMRLRLIDGHTYERIAEIVEMSPRQIREIVKKLKKRLENA